MEIGRAVFVPAGITTSPLLTLHSSQLFVIYNPPQESRPTSLRKPQPATMKIIRHRPSRRAERWDWTEKELERKPKKKALLVGIQYDNGVNGGGEDAANVLRGPHQDVADMRQLLIGELQHVTLEVPTSAQDMQTPMATYQKISRY